jgi:hypothetical protein
MPLAFVLLVEKGQLWATIIPKLRTLWGQVDLAVVPSKADTGNGRPRSAFVRRHEVTCVTLELRITAPAVSDPIAVGTLIEIVRESRLSLKYLGHGVKCARFRRGWRHLN